MSSRVHCGLDVEMSRPEGSPGLVVAFTLPRALERRDAASLALAVSRLAAASGAAEIVCAVGRLERIDLAVVETLACLQLRAKRSGVTLTVLDAPADLLDLLGLCGLRGALGLEAGREPDERE